MRPASIVWPIEPSGSAEFTGTALERSALFVEVPPRNPVLHREDRRVVAAERVEVAGDRGDLMRLHGEDDEILHAGVGCSLMRGDRAGDDLESVFADDAHAALANRVEIGAARDEGHVLAGGGEPSAHVSADCSGADDRDLHARVPRELT